MRSTCCQLILKLTIALVLARRLWWSCGWTSVVGRCVAVSRIGRLPLYSCLFWRWEPTRLPKHTTRWEPGGIFTRNTNTRQTLPKLYWSKITSNLRLWQVAVMVRLNVRVAPFCFFHQQVNWGFIKWFYTLLDAFTKFGWSIGFYHSHLFQQLNK